MHDISQEIFNKYQIRKTKAQKTTFIEFMQSKFPNLKVEADKKARNRNLIIGDINSAKVVVTAHYDTCAVLPIPNFLTPKNLLWYILYQLILVIFMLAPAIAIQFAVSKLVNPEVGLVCYLLTFIVIAYLLMAGKANKHTANDNTSGVITLVELYLSMSERERNNTAFVFFDNEELGLLGSSFFKKTHKDVMQNKLLINYDCVSDGDYALIVMSKNAISKYGEKLQDVYVSTDEKNVEVLSNKKAFYPSDQILFPCSVAVAFFKKSKFFGIYIDKIHTKKDTNFDFANIELIVNQTNELVQKMD